MVRHLPPPRRVRRVPEDLADQGGERVPPHQPHPVVPVRRKDPVPFAHGVSRPDRTRLLAGRRDEEADPARTLKGDRLLVDRPQQHHVPVEREQLRIGQPRIVQRVDRPVRTKDRQDLRIRHGVPPSRRRGTAPTPPRFRITPFARRSAIRSFVYPSPARISSSCSPRSGARRGVSGTPSILIGMPSCRSVPPRGDADVDDHAARRRVRMKQRLREIQNGRDAGVDSGKPLHPLVPGEGEEHRPQRFLDAFPLRAGRVLQSGQVLAPERGRQRLPEPGLERPDAEEAAVRAPVHLVAGEHPGQRQGAALLRHAAAEPGGRRQREGSHRPVRHGDVHPRSLAGPLPPEERHEDPGEGHHGAAEHVPHLHR